MLGGFLYWIKAIGLMALLGASLGGMGAYWYFFWENKEMCPCAPVGLAGGDGLSVVQPYSDSLMYKRVGMAGTAGAAIGAALGLMLAGPQVRRFKSAMTDIDNDNDNDD